MPLACLRNTLIFNRYIAERCPCDSLDFDTTSYMGMLLRYLIAMATNHRLIRRFSPNMPKACPFYVVVQEARVILT